MIVKVLVFANKETGWGHWYRSIALAEHISDCGHTVEIISDRRPPPRFLHHQVNYEDKVLWISGLSTQADWLVIDLPDEAPNWLYDHCRDLGVKTCILNGVGHQVGDRADLRIVQGLGEGEYSGVDYIILRDSVFKAKAIRQPIIDWFVFGGAADRMGICQFFPNWQRISFSIAADEWQAADNHDNGFLLAASQCKRACIAMGMTAWEVSTIGLAPYVFSLSDLHLQFALQMEQAGYIKAWPKEGRPDRQTMVEFLQEPFNPSGKPVDGQAVDRILRLMKGSR